MRRLEQVLSEQSSKQTEITEPLLSKGDTSDHMSGNSHNVDSQQLVIKKDLKKLKGRYNNGYLKDIVEDASKLGLGADTYAMAFKAFNWRVMNQLDMNMKEVH